MWRYLKAAFLVGVPVPGLGRIPVNAMGVFGLGVLGFVEPSVWLVGLGLEAAVVSALAFHPRFQRVVDSRHAAPALEDAESRRAALIAALPAELQARLTQLLASSHRVVAIYQHLGVDPQLIGGTEASLEKLQWIFLKLLVARDHLTNELRLESREDMEHRIAELKIVCATPAQSPALLRSQQATMAIIERRLENLGNRDRLLEENESDLVRIQSQIELMRENAAIEGKPTAVDTQIELASDLASAGLFGIHSGVIDQLEADGPMLPMRTGVAIRKA
jgi:hypothetical protein